MPIKITYYLQYLSYAHILQDVHYVQFFSNYAISKLYIYAHLCTHTINPLDLSNTPPLMTLIIDVSNKEVSSSKNSNSNKLNCLADPQVAGLMKAHKVPNKEDR